MTIPLNDIVVSLAGDATAYFGALNATESQTRSWGGKITRLAGGALAGGFVAGAVGLTAAIGAGATMVFDVTNDVMKAQRELQGELGLTESEAVEMGNVVQGVFANNFGDSVEAVGDAVRDVSQQFARIGEESPSAIQAATEAALTLSDAFETDIAQSTNAASVLMDKFSLDGGQAFDFIAKGFQNGLNSSDDFVDSISEYGNLFADAGFSASQFYSLMETGAEGGVLGTDKIADAVKEFQIRFTEGGSAVDAALKQLTGESWAGFIQEIQSGDATVADVFGNVVNQLQQIEDPIERNQLQVALFGSMAEDLGASFTDGLSMATTSLDDMAGAVDSVGVRYQNFGDLFEGFRRQALVAFTPISKAILQVGSSLMPLVTASFNNLGVAVGSVTPFIESFAAVITTEFAEGSNTMSMISSAFEDFLAFVGPVANMVSQFVTFQDVLLAVGVMVGAVVVPALIAVALAAAPIIAAFAAVVAVVAVVRNAFESNFGGIRDFVTEAVGVVEGVIIAFQELLAGNTEEFLSGLSGSIEQGLTAVVSFAGSLWESIVPILTELYTAFVEWFASTDWQAVGQTVIDAYVTVFSTLWEFVSPTLEAFFVAVSEWFLSGDWISQGLTVSNAFTEGLEMLVEQTLVVLAEWLNSFTEWVNSQDWQTIGFTVVTAIIEGTQQFFEFTRDVLNSWKQSMVGWFDGNQGAFSGLGRSAVDGVISGIRAAASALASAFSGVIRGAIDAAKAAAGISSPSKLTRDLIGANLGEGVVQGLQGHRRKIGQAASFALGDVSANMRLNVPGGHGIVGAMSSGPTQVVTNIQAPDERALVLWKNLTDRQNRQVTEGFASR